MAEQQEIKMDYPLVDAMKTTFDQGSQQLEGTANEMKSIAATLEQGALLGVAGQRFTEALTGKLVPTLAKLNDKLRELKDDLQKAEDAMRGADAQSASKF